MNDDRIGIDAIDAGRINDIGPEIRIAEISPTSQVIRDEPPNEFENMRAGDIGNPVPEDAAVGIFGSVEGKTLHVLYALRIEMNCPIMLGS